MLNRGGKARAKTLMEQLNLAVSLTQIWDWWVCWCEVVKGHMWLSVLRENDNEQEGFIVLWTRKRLLTT